MRVKIDGNIIFMDIDPMLHEQSDIEFNFVQIYLHGYSSHQKIKRGPGARGPLMVYSNYGGIRSAP